MLYVSNKEYNLKHKQQLKFTECNARKESICQEGIKATIKKEKENQP